MCYGIDSDVCSVVCFVKLQVNRDRHDQKPPASREIKFLARQVLIEIIDASVAFCVLLHKHLLDDLNFIQFR